MATRQIITRILANIIFFIKRKDIAAAKLKILVFTGSVGKTTLRNTLAYTLENLEIPLYSNNLGYTNELGIILTIFGYSEISLKNPLSWLRLLKNKVPKERFICIELGADFYQDIYWFLKRFNPYAVFISGVANESWSRDIKEVFKERKSLIEAVPQAGFVFYNADNLPIVELIKQSNISAQVVGFSLENKKEVTITLETWSRNIFTKDISEALNSNENFTLKSGEIKYEFFLGRSLFEPQMYSILATFGFIQKLFPGHIMEFEKILRKYSFSKDRLQMYKTKNGAIIIEDSYKATPICTNWFLDMSNCILAKNKILVLTEMRPLTLNTEYFYSQVASKVQLINRPYFIGPEKYFNILSKVNTRLKKIDKGSYDLIAKEILQNSSRGDLILLKGSTYYNLKAIRNLLT